MDRNQQPTVDHVQTKREIEDLLRVAGLKPRKRFGQHFLIDGNLMRRLVESAELQSSDIVLEVGPGTGGLTDLLAPRAARLICVELDRDLHRLLVERFEAAQHVQIICGDILERKHELSKEAAEMLNEANASADVKLVANLPYNVATPLLLNLLLDYPQVKRFCFTVQAEVGDRILASPGTKAFGPLSILTQLLCRIEQVAVLSRDVFWPKPAVESVMLRMDLLPPPFSDGETLHRFTLFVRRAFEHRRKTLRSSLGYVLEDHVRDAICERFDGTRRPETFSVAEWLTMFQLVDRLPSQ